MHSKRVLADLLACACAFGACACAYFPFMCLRLTKMRAMFGWRALCLNVTLYFLCQGKVRSQPWSSASHPFSPKRKSLSSSRRPSIHRPFVLHSIHRSWKERHLSHFSPSLILSLSLCGLIKLSCAGLFPLAAYSTLQCNNYQNGCILCTHTRPHTLPCGRL